MASDTEKKVDKKAQFDGELVVLHDMISYGDPEHDPVPGTPKGLLYATRGDVLGGDGPAAPTNAEVHRLEALGAVSRSKNTLDAKLALAGQRPDARSAPQYISLTSPAEQIRAAQNVARTGPGVGPQSNKRDLARLALGDLKIMVTAFGNPELADGSDDKDELIGWLCGDYEGATSHADRVEQEQIRDEAQISAREVSAEPGLVGTNVRADGMNAETGEKTVRRESKLQQEDGIVASNAVRKHAAESGVDLSEVKGSGEDGRITKGDVDAAAEAKQNQ